MIFRCKGTKLSRKSSDIFVLNVFSSIVFCFITFFCLWSVIIVFCIVFFCKWLKFHCFISILIHSLIKRSFIFAYFGICNLIVRLIEKVVNLSLLLHQYTIKLFNLLISHLQLNFSPMSIHLLFLIPTFFYH